MFGLFIFFKVQSYTFLMNFSAQFDYFLHFYFILPSSFPILVSTLHYAPWGHIQKYKIHVIPSGP